MVHAACTNWGGLMAARFFLGVGGMVSHPNSPGNANIGTEASIAPGFALITGMFYTREEQPARQAAWFVGNSIAVLLGVSTSSARKKLLNAICKSQANRDANRD